MRTKSKQTDQIIKIDMLQAVFWNLFPWTKCFEIWKPSYWYIYMYLYIYNATIVNTIKFASRIGFMQSSNWPFPEQMSTKFCDILGCD